MSGVIVAGGGWRDFAMTRGKTNPEVRMPDEKDGTNAKAGHNPNVDPLPIGMTVKYVMKYLHPSSQSLCVEKGMMKAFLMVPLGEGGGT